MKIGEKGRALSFSGKQRCFLSNIANTNADIKPIYKGKLIRVKYHNHVYIVEQPNYGSMQVRCEMHEAIAESRAIS